MIIKKLNKDLYNAYNQFLLEHPNALFYHSLKYKEFLETLLGCRSEYLLLCDSSNHIRGILPLMVKNGTYGKVVNSLPYYGSNGSILVNEVDQEKILLNEYYKYLENEDIVASTIISNPLDDSVYNYRHNFKDERIGQWTNIKEISEKTLMEKIDSSTRRNIRKAIKQDIQISINNNAIDFLQKVHNDNMAAIGGIPKEDKFFKLFPNQFEAGTDFNIYIASKNNKPIAGLLVFYFKGVVEYFTPVIDHEFRSDQPLALIIYNAMLDASRNNAVWWNWGGTWLNQEGLYKFKKKWGALDKPYYYYTICEDKSFECLKKEDLLNSYNNFFTLPFGELINEKN
jgi:hypothetical protein